MEVEKFYVLRDSYAKSLMKNLAKDPKNEKIIEELCKTLEIERKDILIGDFSMKQRDAKREVYNFPYTVVIGKINAGELNMKAPNLKYVEGNLIGGYGQYKTSVPSLRIVDGNFSLENLNPTKLSNLKEITGEFSGNIYNIPDFPSDLKCGSVVFYDTIEPTDRRSTGKMSLKEFKEKEQGYKTLFPQASSGNLPKSVRKSNEITPNPFFS